MSYIKTTWNNGDTITAAKINNLEAGVAAAAVTGDIGMTGTATDNALKAGYAVAGLPGHAGVRGRRYDSGRSVYNLKASNTRRLRAALGAARAGTGVARLMFAGDSLTAGYQATRGTSDPVTFLKTELSNRGYSLGELVHAYSNTTEPRITTTGTWSGASLTFPWQGNNGVASTMSYTGAGTVLEIVSSPGGSGFTYSIDGGAAVTVTPSGPAGSVYTTTVTGLTNASHTVQITAAVNTWVYIYALGFRQASGILLDNAGLTSASTQDWLAQPTNYGQAATAFSTTYFANDAVFLELGVNNLLHSVGSPAALTTDLGSLISKIQAQSSGDPATVVLVTSNYPQSHDADWPAWVSAIYDAADAADVPLIDFADRLGLYGTYSLAPSQANADGIHLTPSGYAHKARAWSGLLDT